MSSHKEEILRLLYEGRTYSEICKTVGCVKSTVSYHAKRAGLGKPETCQLVEGSQRSERKAKKAEGVTAKKVYTCIGCSAVLPNSRMYCSRECERQYKISTGQIKGVSNSQRVIGWRRTQKLKAIEYLGGECVGCGYSKCAAALHFHHIDPSKKDFSISSGGMTRAWAKVKVELDKCVLLCGNCHAEVHGGVLDLSLE